MSEVADLARAAGLLVDWEDAGGAPRTVGEDALRAILAGMGLPSGTPGEVADSRAELQRREAEAAGFVTAVVGEAIRIRDPGEGRGRLTLESGEGRDVTVANGLLPALDEVGYHRLEIGGREVALAVAPRRAFTIEDVAPGRRLWGPAAQVYALREGPSAFGDFGALARFAAAAARRGADALAISPVHALFAADSGRYSPYSPSTRLFLNVLYAEPLAVPGEGGSAEPAGGELIDWASAIPARLARLRALYDRFRQEDGPRRDAFEAFRRERGADLEGHARYEALHAHFFAERGAGGWREWPEAYHDPRGAAVEAFARAQPDEVRFHAFLQWLADRSLAAAQAAAKDGGMALGLIADVAVGMDPGGSHAWSRPDDLLQGLSVGAPPDMFQAAGQDWGIATFAPHALRRSGFEAFIQTLRAALRHAGGLRIDHAMGLRRLWLVPHGAAATEGAYLRYPMEDFLRLIALESHRARAVVVGEDLGTVPEGFRDALDAAGVMGMRVLSFERTEEGGFTPPGAWSAEAAALSTTHDLPTIAGWWRERDIEWADRVSPDTTDAPARRKARAVERTQLWRTAVDAGVAGGPEPAADAPADAVDAALGLVASTPCRLAILPVEDLLGLEEQPNLPGTIDEHPNWRRRLPADAETLLSEPGVAARLERIDRLRRA